MERGHTFNFITFFFIVLKTIDFFFMEVIKGWTKKDWYRGIFNNLKRTIQMSLFCFFVCLFYSNCTWLIHLRFSYFICVLNLLNYFNILLNVYNRYSPKHTQFCFESSINTKALCCWSLWYMLTSLQPPFPISPVGLLFKYPHQ